jgi:hypothetical protein
LSERGRPQTYAIWFSSSTGRSSYSWINSIETRQAVINGGILLGDQINQKLFYRVDYRVYQLTLVRCAARGRSDRRRRRSAVAGACAAAVSSRGRVQRSGCGRTDGTIRRSQMQSCACQIRVTIFGWARRPANGPST